jgi:hypothetical protein
MNDFFFWGGGDLIKNIHFEQKMTFLSAKNYKG